MIVGRRAAGGGVFGPHEVGRQVELGVVEKRGGGGDGCIVAKVAALVDGCRCD